MSDICVTTTVNQDYQEFIPWFLLFLTDSYPCYAVRLFVAGECSDNVRRCIERIRLEHEADFKVVENCFKGLPTDKFGIKALRWLNLSEEFDRFDHLYIGDIDILICREEPDLLTQHLRHCELLGLPYSNVIRPGKEKLSGLHFVLRAPWYDAMRPIRARYERRLREGSLSVDDFPLGNEQLLYRMVAESGLGLPPTPEENPSPDYQFRPHHGFHLRIWHNRKRQDPEYLLKSEWGPLVIGDKMRRFCRQVTRLRQAELFRYLDAQLGRPREMMRQMVRFYEHLGYL